MQSVKTCALLSIFWVVIALCLFVVALGVALAADTSDAKLSAAVTVTNGGFSALSPSVFPYPMTTQGMINSAIIAADTLDVEMENSADDLIPFMPSPTQTALESCKLFDQTAGTFTTDTTDCNNAGANDIALTIDEVDDAFYFGGHWPYRILRLNIGTAGVGTYTITWEYCSDNSTGGATTTCDAWTGVSNVVDATNGFTVNGTRTVSWNIAEMQESTEDSAGTPVQSYWIRARVSAFTSITTSPNGTQYFWDMGMFWAFDSNDIASGASRAYEVSTGFSTPRTFHNMVGSITTPDTGALEGISALVMEIKFYADPTATGSTRDIFTKGGDFYIRWDASNDGEIDILLTDTSPTTCTMTVTGVTQGLHTIRVRGNDTLACRVFLDDVEEDTGAAIGAPLNNGSDWIFGANIPYLEFVKLGQNGAGGNTIVDLYLHYEINNAFTALLIPDRATSFGGTTNGTPSFPTIPTDFTYNTASFLPPSAQGVFGAVGSSDIVGQADNVDNFAQSVGTGSQLPGQAGWLALTNAAGIPVQFILLVLALVVSLVALVAGYLFSGSTLFGMFCAGFAMVLIMTAGIFPLWVPVVFGIFGAAILVFAKGVIVSS